MPRELPSLSAVRAFEAAARHGSVKAAAAELGVNSFLGKPFQENELLATIDRLVD